MTRTALTGMASPRWRELFVGAGGRLTTGHPDRIRPRVMALLASMWILPGLLGAPSSPCSEAPAVDPRSGA
jgi:hypothetical protein